MHTKTARHPLEAQPAVIESDAGKLAKPEAIETALATKARKPRLAASLHAAEEAPVRLVELLESPALQAKWKRGCVRVRAPPLGQRSALIDISSRKARIAIGAHALFQGGVIELALTFQNCFECAVLRLARQ